MDDKLSIHEIDGKISINYQNYDEDVLKYFDSKGMQGGGYTWEALVRAALELKSPDLIDNVEFDPEGDAFLLTSMTKMLRTH